MDGVEEAIADGSLHAGERLPAVRALARDLGVSPATVAAAYRTLAQRGVVGGQGRRGTIVAPQPPLRIRGARPLPAGARDLASGNPDPALLPPLAPAVARIDPRHRLYGEPAKLEALVALAEQGFAADGVAGDVAIVGGALDGIERALQSRLLPGDRIAIEDPTWPRITDLVRALGLVPVPVELDESGVLPDALERGLAAGAKAAIVTPRGQNPTGAALAPERGEELREVLARHPSVVVVEDDYVAAVAGAGYVPVHGTTSQWAVVRSLSKVAGPDLRIALMAGDPRTISRVEGRQLLGPGWVSHLLQQIAARLLGAAATGRLLARAERAYAERRRALIEALAVRGIPAMGGSGLGVWIPVTEEVSTTQLLLEQGWAVSPGERFRIRAAPGLRVTTAALPPEDADAFAGALARILGSGTQTYAG